MLFCDECEQSIYDRYYEIEDAMHTREIMSTYHRKPVKVLHTRYLCKYCIGAETDYLASKGIEFSVMSRDISEYEEW